MLLRKTDREQPEYKGEIDQDRMINHANYIKMIHKMKSNKQPLATLKYWPVRVENLTGRSLR